MRLGRLILTHRQDLISSIKEFYLPSKTNFLVVGYNKKSVNANLFQENENFKMHGYQGNGPSGSLAGRQYVAWAEVARKYPEIDIWVMHDYDVLCKPTDAEMTKYLESGQYGVVGQPFASTKVARSKDEPKDVFPYFVKDLDKSIDISDNYAYWEKELLKLYPIYVHGIKSIFTGNGDLIVGHRDIFLFLEDEHIRSLDNGGAEQVPHTLFAYHGIRPLDLRKYFSIFFSLDNNIYASYNNSYDISHPVKFWSGGAKPSLKIVLKKFIAYLLRYNRVARSRPGNQ